MRQRASDQTHAAARRALRNCAPAWSEGCAQRRPPAAELAPGWPLGRGMKLSQVAVGPLQRTPARHCGVPPACRRGTCLQRRSGHEGTPGIGEGRHACVPRRVRRSKLWAEAGRWRQVCILGVPCGSQEDSSRVGCDHWRPALAVSHGTALPAPQSGFTPPARRSPQLDRADITVHWMVRHWQRSGYRNSRPRQLRDPAMHRSPSAGQNRQRRAGNSSTPAVHQRITADTTSLICTAWLLSGCPVRQAYFAAICARSRVRGSRRCDNRVLPGRAGSYSESCRCAR